jgi:hypothetical protein
MTEESYAMNDRRAAGRRMLVLVASAATFAAATLAAASDGPSAISEARVVPPGGKYVLDGEGWFVGPRCVQRVEISRRESHGVRIGSAAVRDNGTFRFSHRVPRRAARGTRIVLDVTQFCDGVGTTRTVRLRVGRASRGCPEPLSVDRAAYAIKVFGGLGCTAGARAVGAFIDTDVEPAGWTCARADRRIAGHDFECIETARPGRRVTARRVREV